MRNFFRPEIFVGFICGVIFAIFSEFMFGIPSRVPVFVDYSIPIQYEVHEHHHGYGA